MYNIVRSYKNGTPEIIEEDVTLAEAQAHCDEQADNNTLESI